MNPVALEAIRTGGLSQHALAQKMLSLWNVMAHPTDIEPEKRRARLLLAEDDDEMRSLLERVFTNEGYEVAVVEDGFELENYLRACSPRGSLPSPDIIVSDIRMPGLTALEVITRLKCNNGRLILITAFGDAKTHAEGLRLGATLVLDKPVDIDLLRSAVRDALPQRHQQ